MIATIKIQSKTYQVDLNNPIDISLEIQSNEKNVIAWYLDKPVIKPEVFNGNEMSLKNGAPVNFNTITFNPHGHGTHTETVSHILDIDNPINKSLKTFFYRSKLVSVLPEDIDNDKVITKQQIQDVFNEDSYDALIIRTLPNMDSKRNKNYSNTNPPYLSAEAAEYIKDKGVKHLLIDLPSVDKENDEGKLLAHHAFWNTQLKVRLEATITELIYVPSHIKDGCYLLNLQIASFNNDATPSKPVLYALTEEY